MAFPSTIYGRLTGDSLNGSLIHNAPVSAWTEFIGGTIVGGQTGDARPVLQKELDFFNGRSGLFFDKEETQFIDFGDNFDLGTGDIRIFVVAKRKAGNMCFFSKREAPFPAGGYAMMVYTPPSGDPLHGGLYSFTDGINSNNATVPGIADADTTARIYELHIKRSASNLAFSINSAEKSSRTVVGDDDELPLDNSQHFRVGYYADILPLPFDGWIAEIAFGRNMSDQDVIDTYAELNSLYIPSAPPMKVRELGIGHSMLEGVKAPENTPASSLESPMHLYAEKFGLENVNSFKYDFPEITNPAHNYVLPQNQYLVNAYDPAKLIDVENYARGGARLDEMIAKFDTQYLTKAADYDENLVTFWGDANNISTDTIEQMQEKTEAYCDLVHAHGGKIRVLSMPAFGGIYNAPYIEKRLLRNALLRSDHSFADSFVDLARHRLFADLSDDIFESDDTHLRTLGNQIVADMLYADRMGTLEFPVITKESLSAATVGAAYEEIITADGATSFEFISGDLPDGIEWDETNHKFVATEVTGTAGTFSNLIVRAFNDDDLFDEKSYSITVSSSGNTKKVRCFWLPPVTGDTPDGYRVNRVRNGNAPGITDAGNNLQLIDTDVTEGDVLTYYYQAYKAMVSGEWYGPFTINFTNNVGGLVNFALASMGATASANHTYTDGGYDGAASNAIDGDRLFKGTNWSINPGGIYHSYGGGAILTINFNQTRSIEKVVLVTMRDVRTDKSPITDANTETFSELGVTDFTFQYWTGTEWSNIAVVSSNNRIIWIHTFVPITTTKIRVLGNAGSSSRIAEVEAWG